MKSMTCGFLLAAIFAASGALAQTSTNHGARAVVPRGPYPGMTNAVTASGTLIVETLVRRSIR